MPYLSLFTLAVVALALPAARAQLACAEADDRGLQRCVAALPGDVVRKMTRTQEKSKWCWAASLSMIFARHGHEISQEEIVREIVGEPLNVGLPTHLIAGTINRDWYQSGWVLRTSAREQLLLAGEKAPASVHLLVTSLARGEPLLLSAHGHGLVVVGIGYDLHGPSGALRITSGTVIDPLPGVGVRAMSLSELSVSLLARVDLRRLRRPDAFVSVRELEAQHDDEADHTHLPHERRR
jgi:hypothetical protein